MLAGHVWGSHGLRAAVAAAVTAASAAPACASGGLRLRSPRRQQRRRSDQSLRRHGLAPAHGASAAPLGAWPALAPLERWRPPGRRALGSQPLVVAVVQTQCTSVRRPSAGHLVATARLHRSNEPRAAAAL
eukprot:scaffold4402_cov338-Prasinococcus_capsulatus_cf.AAC.4